MTELVEICDEVLSVAELAARWSCSASEVYKLVSARQIPHFRVGSRRICIYLADIVAYEQRTYDKGLFHLFDTKRKQVV